MRINHFSSCLNKSKNFKAHTLLHKDDIGKLRPVENLFFLAHPDDETCFFYHLTNLVNVDPDSVLLVYTNLGQKGRDARGILERYDPRMKDLRADELAHSTDDGYGLNRAPLIMDFIDGETHTDNVKKQMEVIVENIIRNVKPKNIFTFEPNGITNHTDHKAISEVATDVFVKNKTDLTQNSNLYHVGLTDKAKDLLIAKTQNDTHIFTYAKAGLSDISKEYDVSNFIEIIDRAMSFYKSQFNDKAIKAFCNYIQEYPFINMILRK